MAYTNLFDGWLEQGGIDTSTTPGQNIDSSVRIRSRNYTKVSASTSYSMYRKYANGGFGVRYYDSSKTFLSNTSPFASTTKGGLFVTPANCAYIRFIDETNRLDNRYWMAKSTALLDDSKFAQVIAIGQCTLYDVTDVYTSANEPPMAERYDGFLWLDTATDTIKKWDAASKQWVILNDFTNAIQEAVNGLQEQLNDIVSDSVLTPSEKLILANEMERVKQETNNLIASAEDLSISYADLKSAYDALYKYISPFITETMMQVNSDIDAEKYKTLFKNYYTAKEALEKSIKSELNVQEEVDALKRYTRNILLTSGNYNLGKRIQWIEDGKAQWYIEPKDGYVQLTKSGTGTQSWACLPLSQSITVGETYTLMFKFRRSQKLNFNLYLANYAGRSSYTIDSVVETIAVDEWQTHTVTFTAISSMSNADYLMFTSTDFPVDKETLDFEWLILSKGERIDEWSPAYEDVDDMYDTLIGAISDADKTIRFDITEYVDKANAAVGREISEKYTLKTETETIQQALTSFMEQTPEDITAAFTQAQTYTTEVDGTLQTFIKELETYIRFSIEGIELGEVDSPFMTKLDNTKLAFIQSGTEIAYISNHKLYITEAEISHRLTFGTAEKGYFDWIVEDNGSLSLARRNV